MKSYDSSTLTALRAGLIVPRLLFCAVEHGGAALCLWSGEIARAFTVEGGAMSFTPAYGQMSVDPIMSEAGLGVQVRTVTFSSVAPEIEDMVKGYQIRYAPVRLYRVLLDPRTLEPVADPHRVFKGVINGVTFERPAPGQVGTCAVECASSSRALTKRLTAMQSHAEQKRRQTDKFRQYADVAGNIRPAWGAKS